MKEALQDFWFDARHANWSCHLIIDRPRIWFYRIYYDGYWYSLHLGFFSICLGYTGDDE